MGKNAEKLADMYGEFLDIEINEIIAESEKDPHRFSERFESRMNEMIYSGEAARKNRKSTGAKRSRIIWIIAAAILVLAATACAVPSIRESIAGFFVRIFSDHVEYSDPDITKNSIEEEYGLVPIPEGFAVSNTIRTNDTVITDYSDKNGTIISLTQTINKDWSESIDNEHGDSFEYSISGKTVLVQTSFNAINAAWVENGYYFSLIVTDTIELQDFSDLISHVNPK